MKKERIGFIDVAKCIAMILVIHNHWMLDYNNSHIKIFIAAFHMPLFFLLSGLTIKSPSNKTDIKMHIFKRIKYILLPFYLWSFMYTGFGLKKLLFILWGSNPSIGMAGGIGGSWFLPCFFIADLIACFILWFSRKQKRWILVLSVLCFVISWMLGKVHISYGFPFNFDVALSGAAFICIGYYARERGFFNVIEKLKVSKQFCFIFILFIITIVFAFCNYSAYSNAYGRLVMALGYYGNYFLFVIGGISGSLLIMMISICIQNTKISGYLKKVGTNTFSILMVQQLCIGIMEKIISKLNISLNFIYPLILSIFCIVICHYVTIILTEIWPNLKGVGTVPSIDKL